MFGGGKLSGEGSDVDDLRTGGKPRAMTGVGGGEKCLCAVAELLQLGLAVGVELRKNVVEQEHGGVAEVLGEGGP